MKAVSFAVLSIFFLAQFSDAALIGTGVNDGVSSTLVDDITAILNRAVNLTIKQTGNFESILKSIPMLLGDTLELSGLTKDVDQVARNAFTPLASGVASPSSTIQEVETIVIRQLGGVVTFVLKRVTGLVFKVVEIVPSILNTLVSGIGTELSLLNETGGSVLVDLAKVTELVLKTVGKTGDSVTSLVLSLV